ncbi:TPA: O-antigen ligase family protein [Enterococcus faecalis]|nr:O-antigen ligase family protein [Enterococcus faecalis]
MWVNNFLEKTKLPFLIIFEFMLLLRTISLYSLLPSKVDTLVFGLISIWAMVYILNQMFFILKNKRFKQFDPMLVIFIVMLFFVTLIHYQTYFIANLKLVIWQAIFLLVIYQIGKEQDKKTFKVLEKILLIVWGLLVVIAICMFFIQYSYTAPLDKIYNGLRIGFFENRLYGVFADPNFAATISVVSIILSVSLLFQTTLKKWKWLLIMNTLIQWIYITLYGSRTAFVELMVIIFVGSFFVVYQKTTEKKLGLQLLYSIITSIGMVFFAYIATKLIERGMLAILDLWNNVEYKSTTNVSKNRPDVSLDRPDVENKTDISNNRFGLWKSSFEIFQSNIWFGTSPRNLVTYAQHYLPNTLIAVKQQTSHNFFFYTLATTGLAGTIPLILFLINKILTTLQVLFSKKINIFNDNFLRNVLIVLTILVSAMFLTELILVNKIGTFLFWLYLGSVSSQLVKNNNKFLFWR